MPHYSRKTARFDSAQVSAGHVRCKGPTNHERNYSIGTMRSLIFANRSNTAGSWLGARSRAREAASERIRSCARRSRPVLFHRSSTTMKEFVTPHACQCGLSPIANARIDQDRHFSPRHRGFRDRQRGQSVLVQRDEHGLSVSAATPGDQPPVIDRGDVDGRESTPLTGTTRFSFSQREAVDA